MPKSRLVTIGIPVRNEQSNIPDLINRLDSVLQEIQAKGYQIEIIVNNNASEDASAELLNEWARTNPKVKINHLAFLIPFQDSILKLMRESKGDAFVLLQSDLQDPPELIPTFIQKWENGSIIVAGVIAKRMESIWQRLTRHAFYLILRMFSDGDIVPGFQDFYLVDREVVKELKHLSPMGLFLRGHISSQFGNIEKVIYVRDLRIHGETKFNFPAKYSLALDGLLLFGTRFIRIISTISFSMFCAGVLGIVSLLISFFFGFRPAMHGWASLVTILLIAVSLLGMTMALVLEYLIRIYRFLIFSKYNENRLK